jgi:hypothetical protein
MILSSPLYGTEEYLPKDITSPGCGEYIIPYVQVLRKSAGSDAEYILLNGVRNTPSPYLT